jgi:hypothetical protein
MQKLTEVTLDKLREVREGSRESFALRAKLKDLSKQVEIKQRELANLLSAVAVVARIDSAYEEESAPIWELEGIYREELRKAEEEGIYPEAEAPSSPPKPTSLAENVQEIAASMEGDFRVGDVRKLLEERDPELYGKSHGASITTALARLAAEGGPLERVSGGGRGNEAVFRRRV